ncbi:MAG: ATP-binding protein, partial [Thermoplasmata archaeon]
MFRKFVDREFERNFLEERYASGEFELMVIYGRRRQGKTELMKNFMMEKPHLYFLCDKAGTERNGRRFRSRVAGFLDEPEMASADFAEIFAHLAKRAAGKRLIVAMDEFTYLADRDKAVPSIFQAIADEVLRGTDMFLMLCGSSISMMEKGVLSRKSPLYGRKTGHIRLAHLPFGAFAEFYPGNGIADNIEFHAAIGGVPFYMERFLDDRSAVENIKEQIMDRGGHLYEELDFLLRE